MVSKKATPFFYIFLLLLVQTGFAQQDTTSSQKKRLVNASGFVDAFYAYDFNQSSDKYRLPFLVNHNRHNRFNVNLALIKIVLDHSRYRSAIAIQAGTYAVDNYAAEPDFLKYISECNVGAALNQKRNLWLDVGILNSHIGFESAVSIDNWNLTRSLLAELSPYYMAGAKLTYNPSKKLELAALVCNGWQRIQPVVGNSLPAFGTQLKYTHSKNVLLNWSTFVGTDDSNITRRMRYFNNFYGQFQFSEKIGIIAGFDIGMQQKLKRSQEYGYWFSPVLIARCKFTPKLATAVRYEYYEDKFNIIVPAAAVKNHALYTSGLSLNLDYTPVPVFACRVEGRWLSSPANIYPLGSSYTQSNLAVTASVAIRFE